MLLMLSKSQVIYSSKIQKKKKRSKEENRKEKPSYNFQEQLSKCIYHKFYLDMGEQNKREIRVQTTRSDGALPLLNQ